MRRAFQKSAEPTSVLARRYGANPKTVAKWRRRTSLDDLPMGPKTPRSTVLDADDEALIVAFRKLTRASLDACWACLKPMIPYLTRSGLHRCLRRWRISRIPPALRPAPIADPDGRRAGQFDLDAIPFDALGSKRWLLMATNRTRTAVFAGFAETLDAEVVAVYIDALAREPQIAVRSIAAPPSIVFASTPPPLKAVQVEGRPSAFFFECRKRAILPLNLPISRAVRPKIVPGWTDVAAAAKPTRAGAIVPASAHAD